MFSWTSPLSDRKVPNVKVSNISSLHVVNDCSFLLCTNIISSYIGWPCQLARLGAYQSHPISLARQSDFRMTLKNGFGKYSLFVLSANG